MRTLAYDGSIKIGTNIDNKGIAAGIKRIRTSLTGLASAIGLAFGTAAVVNFRKESVKAASELSNALQGLQSIVEGQGRSFSEAKAFIQDYIADGLVPMTNAVTAYKNLAARGYDDAQIQQVMTALKDSAAYGRQASYSLGDAVTSATEGLKNENSILVDNAGVTKNVAKMWDDYAKSIGTTTNNLTQQQKIQAEVNGILEETRFQTGDAAKVAQSYSGQVSQRVFNFQNLKVAVGNALIPIAQAVLPSINAMITGLTEIVTLAGQVVSALFGTQAKKQKDVAATASKAAKQENELAKATNAAAKAAKAAISGFDELNILQAETANPGELNTGLDSTDANVLPAINDADAGKISQKAQEIADKIRETIRNIRQALSDFAPLLSGIATGFATAFGLKWVAGAVNKIKKLSGSSAILKGIAAAAGTINTNFKATGKLFPSLNSGLKTFRSNLSTTTKAMVGAAGAITAFVTLKSAIKEVTLENMDLCTAMTNIIPILGAVGVALYAALGPWGLLAGGIAAAAGAIFGYSEAQAKMKQEALEASFFDGLGVPIDTFTERIRGLGEEVSQSTDYIRGIGEQLDSNQSNVENAVRDIDYLLGKIQMAGGSISEEDIPKIEDAFNSLYANIKSSMDLSAQSLIYTLQTVVGESTGKAADEIDGMIGKVYELNALLAKDADQIKKQMDEILLKIQKGTATEQDYTQLDLLASKMANLGSEATLAESKFRTAVQKITEQKIDFKDTDEAKATIEEIGKLGTQMVDDLQSASAEAVRVVDTYLNSIDQLNISDDKKKELKESFKEIRQATIESFEIKEEDVKQEIAASLGAIQNQLSEQTQALIEEEKKKGKSLWDRMLDVFSSDEQKESNRIARNKEIESSVNRQFSDIQEAIDAAAGKLEIKPDPDMGQKLLDGMYEYGANAAAGFEEGAKSGQDKVTQAGEELFDAVESGTRKEGGYGSPSKVMKQYGEWADEGFAQGVTNRKNVAVNAFSGLFNAVLDKTDSFCSRFRTAINDALEGMRKAVNSTTISADGKISYSKMPPVKIPRLATGAVIPPRAQFLAVLGDQSHGRNLEAPESLIRQIVREEGGGNQEALLDRLDRLIAVAESIDPQVTVNLGDREVAQAAQRGTRKLGYPIGGV